jgi:hypothetical protein
MEECVILFLHLNVAKKFNPKIPIIPIYAKLNHVNKVENAVCVNSTIQNVHWHVDQLLVDWFLTTTVKAKRYILFEYDTLCTAPVESIFKNVWNEHAAAARVFYNSKDPWWWGFTEFLKTIPPEYHKYAAGLVPINGVLISHQAFTCLANNHDKLKTLYCEMRIGTILQKEGFKLNEVSKEFQMNNHWKPESIKLSKKPGLYHPVKSVNAIIELQLTTQESKPVPIHKLLI